MGKLIKIAAAIAVAMAFAASPARAAGERVRYVANSDAPLLSVSYYDAMNEMTQEQNLPSSWSKSFVVQATYGLHSIAAQTTGAKVSCEIDINGQVVAQQTTVGRYTMAVCAG